MYTLCYLQLTNDILSGHSCIPMYEGYGQIDLLVCSYMVALIYSQVAMGKDPEDTQPS